MSKIQEFVDAVNQYNDRIDTAIDGLSADITALKEEIERLQNTPGEITPEDQALLDSIQTRVGAIADKLSALDAATEQTPPVPPVVEPPVTDETAK